MFEIFLATSSSFNHISPIFDRLSVISIIDSAKLKKVKIIAVDRIEEVLKHALVWKGKEKILKKISKK